MPDTEDFSITTWHRLEPTARDEQMADALEARIHDPLWMLCRQWQLGEFQGEDAGTPVEASFVVEGCPLSRYGLGSGPGSLAYPRNMPLEALVEGEQQVGEGRRNRRLAVECGQEFWRMAGDALAEKYRQAYLGLCAVRLTEKDRAVLDASSLAFLQLMDGRALDGVALYDTLTADLKPSSGTGRLRPIPGSTAMQEVANDWLRRYELVFRKDEPPPPPAWIPERMEYEFCLASPSGTSPQTPQEIRLVAHEYLGGHLDWPSFSFALEARQLEAAGPVVTERGQAIPTMVNFPGMPTARYWEIEDGQVNFGALEVAPDELARLLLIEFAMVYGNDFFIVPVELNVGAYYRIRSLQVRDTFGDSIPVPEANSHKWRMFCLDGDDQEQGLFLAPVLGPSLHSEAHEEVVFLRDEMANLVWAVEHVVDGPIGQPVDRAQAYQDARRRAKHDDSLPGDSLVYRLATSVPDYWIPLVLQRIQDSPPMLQRGVLLDVNDVGQPMSAQGLVLRSPRPDQPFRLYEEEVPREGVRVERRYQFARSTDGAGHLWMTRQKRVGRGEGSSGLRFDAIEPQSDGGS